jgi:hypothetical protein
MLSVAGFLGLRRERFDLISFVLIVLVVLIVTVNEHMHALYGEILVK